MTRQDEAQWAPPSRPDLRSFVPRERRVAPLLLWLACLAGALALLLWLGDGRLAAPDLTSPSTWGAWAGDRGTAEAVVAVLRIVALGLAWYLVGITTVSVLAHAARAARLVRLADALSFGPVRTVVQQALGVGLAVGVLASALPPDAFGADGSPVATATVAAIADDDVGIGWPVRLPAAGTAPDGRASPEDAVDRAGTAGEATRMPDAAGGDAPPVPAPEGDGPWVVARSLGDEPASPADRSRPASAPPAAGRDRLVATPVEASRAAPTAGVVADGDAEAGATDAGGGTGAVDGTIADAAPGGAVPSDEAGDVAGTIREVRVEPGDHLWGLAEGQLRDELGRQPTEREIVVQWERVMDLNTERLVVPSNPDLLRPGQQILLPPVEVRG